MGIKKYLGWCLKGIRLKIKKPFERKWRRIIASILILFVSGFAGYFIGKQNKKEEPSISEKRGNSLSVMQEESSVVQSEDKDTEELPWNLVLVNGEYPMEEGYVPELVEIQDGYSVDARIEDATNEMLKAAKEAGLDVQICSAYRSVDKQASVFNESMDERIKSGMNYLEAFQETSLNVAAPGTSEHALGLALDLISSQYQELDERQQETPEARWLAENCYKYGFILRYPPEKTNITGIIYEPWHYRYVGVEHAAKIMELEITLEEYLEK